MDASGGGDCPSRAPNLTTHTIPTKVFCRVVRCSVAIIYYTRCIILLYNKKENNKTEMCFFFYTYIHNNTLWRRRQHCDCACIAGLYE